MTSIYIYILWLICCVYATYLVLFLCFSWWLIIECHYSTALRLPWQHSGCDEEIIKISAGMFCSLMFLLFLEWLDGKVLIICQLWFNHLILGVSQNVNWCQSIKWNDIELIFLCGLFISGMVCWMVRFIKWIVRGYNKFVQESWLNNLIFWVELVLDMVLEPMTKWSRVWSLPPPWHKPYILTGWSFLVAYEPALLELFDGFRS